MPTNKGTGLLALLAAVALCGCGTRPGNSDVSDVRPENSDRSKVLPPSSLQYHLQVDSASLPAGVSTRERQVPGTDQVQTWIGNPSDIPFVIISTDLQGKVIRRQKIQHKKVFIEPAPLAASTAESQWQHLEGVEDVLISLNFTPAPIVAGRTQPAVDNAAVPPPEAFSILATFGGEAAPIRGTIVYSLAADSRR